jgi:hypothetical protein
MPIDLLTLFAVVTVVIVTTTINIVLANRQGDKVSASIQEVRTALDGRMTELLSATAKSSRFEGAEDERRESRARDDAGRNA